MKTETIFNLEKRTAALSKRVFLLVKPLRLTILNRNIIEQLVRAVSSIAANYMEANESESKRDFAHKVGICKKEAKETKYWLEMLVLVEENLDKEIAELQDELSQLLKIFQTMIDKVRLSLK